MKLSNETILACSNFIDIFSCNIDLFLGIENFTTTSVNIPSFRFKEWLDFSRLHLTVERKKFELSLNYKIPTNSNLIVKHYDAFFNSVEDLITYCENKYHEDLMEDTFESVNTLIYGDLLQTATLSGPDVWRVELLNSNINDFSKKKTLIKNIHSNMLDVYQQGLEICEIIKELEF